MMLDDLQAEYDRLAQELAQLQRERTRLNGQPFNHEEERVYALQLRIFHARVVAYLARLERLQSAEPEGQA